jgi:polar amino acid transport system substrate-binding protein
VRDTENRGTRTRTRTLLAAGTAGLMLAGTVLTGALRADPGAAPDPGARGTDAVQAQETRPLAERERCDDGRDPAESYAPSLAEGEAVRRIQKNEELVVGVDQNSYLWGFRAPDTSEIVGFDIDLVEEIAENLLGPKPRIRYKAVPTAERFRLLRDREIDMVVRTVSITCRRWEEEEVAFSAAYFEAGQQVLAPRSSEIEGFDASLDGQRVCSAAGSTAEALLKAEAAALNIKQVSAGNHLDCLVLIQLDGADALMTDSALAAGHAAQDPAMRLVGEVLTVEPYGVAMHQDDVDLVRRVNAVLEDFTAGPDSDWRRSYDRWLADHMELAAPRPPDPLYRD